MSPNFKCFIVSIAAFLAALAWNDEWVDQQGIKAIIIALGLLAMAGLWMAFEHKGE